MTHQATTRRRPLAGAVVAATLLASGPASAEPVTAAAIAISGLILGASAHASFHHSRHSHHPVVAVIPAPAAAPSPPAPSAAAWTDGYLQGLSHARARGADCWSSGIYPDRCRHLQARWARISEPQGMPGEAAAAHPVMSASDWQAWEHYRRWAEQGHEGAKEVWARSRETPKWDPLTGQVRMWNAFLGKWFY